MGLEFDERRVKRTQEDQAMNPIVRTHTKEDMSVAKEGKQEDTMCKVTNCNSISLLGHEIRQRVLPMGWF